MSRKTIIKLLILSLLITPAIQINAYGFGIGNWFLIYWNNTTKYEKTILTLGITTAVSAIALGWYKTKQALQQIKTLKKKDANLSATNTNLSSSLKKLQETNASLLATNTNLNSSLNSSLNKLQEKSIKELKEMRWDLKRKILLIKMKANENPLAFKHKYFNSNIAQALSQYGYKEINNETLHYDAKPQKLYDLTTKKISSKENITIREYKKSDWKSVKKILRQKSCISINKDPKKDIIQQNTLLLFNDNVTQKHTLKKMWKEHISNADDKQIVRVITFDEKVVGFIAYCYDKECFLYISYLAVDQNLKGQRLGTRLINYVAEEAKKNIKIEEIYLSTFNRNHASRIAYEKLGFYLDEPKQKEEYVFEP